MPSDPLWDTTSTSRGLVSVHCNAPTQTSVTCHNSETRLWVWIINKIFPFHSLLIILHQGHVCISLVNCNHLFEPAPWFISSSLAPVGWIKCAWISKVSTNLTGSEAARTSIPRMFHTRQLQSRPWLLSETSPWEWRELALLSSHKHY